MTRGVFPIALVLLALLALLGMTVISSFFLTGTLNIAATMAISITQAILIFWFYMHLNESSALIRLVAIGAVVWLIFLFSLTSADFATRSLF